MGMARTLTPQRARSVGLNVRLAHAPFPPHSQHSTPPPSPEPGQDVCRVAEGLRLGGSGGTVLAETYDLAPTAAARLVNLSTRGAASTSQPLIVGFVSRAAAPRAWLIRAAGPALTRFGVEGALPDPQLTVTSPTGEWIATNSGRSRDPVEAAVTAQRAAQAGAVPFVADLRDAAVVVDRAPGGTTVIIGAASTARGTVLAEIYALP